MPGLKQETPGINMWYADPTHATCGRWTLPFWVVFYTVSSDWMTANGELVFT